MRKVLALAAGLAAAFTLTVAPAHATNIGNQGCTPGYWKNHPDAWQEAHPDTLLNFDPPSALIPAFAPTTDDLDGDGVPDTFLAALKFKGGNTFVGAQQILFRAAVAAWLNAANEGLGYPERRKDFVPEVNAAVATGDRDTVLNLASELDSMNNLGCPLS